MLLNRIGVQKVHVMQLSGFFINLKPKNNCYIRNYEEKCKGGCECDHSKIEVRAEQFLK